MRWYHKLLLALFVLTVLVAFAAAIGWPFWWKMVFAEPPPTDVTTFASLLTIVLTLLALGVAAFGVLAYYLLREFLKRDLQKDVETKFMRAMAYSENSVAFGFWRTWRIQRDDWELLDAAILAQQRALERLANVKVEELPERERKAIYQAKSNLAGYIACKSRCLGVAVSASEIARARKEGKEAYDKAGEFGGEYDWKANYVAVLRAFGTESERRTAEQIISELRERATKGEINTREMTEYQDLWGN